MTFIDKIGQLWRSNADRVVHGWVDATVEQGAEGRNYLQVRCTDLGLRYDREWFAERRPVLQGVVRWPHRGGSISVSSTIGPSNFTNLHDGGFGTLVSSDVELTGNLPLNSSDVEVTVGLLAAPGESLLDRASKFLGDLGELTKIPQLTAAAPVAQKIATGVDSLLGNDDTKGLLAFRTTIPADTPRRGYYVLTDWPTTTGNLGALRVADSKLEVNYEGIGWSEPQGFNYLVLEFRVEGSKPTRWEELPEIFDAFSTAIDKLANATTKKAVAEAGVALELAVNAAQSSSNLTATDREVAEIEMLRKWDRRVQRRSREIAAAAEEQGGAAAPDVVARSRAIEDAGARVLTQTRKRLANRAE